MKEHDAELLKFDATEIEDEADLEADTDLEDTEKQGGDENPKLEIAKKANEQKTITSAMVKSWCNSILLVEMLGMKELNRPPTGGVGKGVDLRTLLKVSIPAVKTRAFQEACVYSVVEEVVEHLSQWSCSVAFFELSSIPTLRLRSFCKSTKAERFRKEMNSLARLTEANSEFVNKKRASIKFLPNDVAAASFLEDEKKAGKSPLSQYAEIIRQRAQQRNESLVESDVIVGENSAVFGKNAPSSDEEDNADRIEKGAAAFNPSWLPGSDFKKRGREDEEEKEERW